MAEIKIEGLDRNPEPGDTIHIELRDGRSLEGTVSNAEVRLGEAFKSTGQELSVFFLEYQFHEQI